MRDTFPQIYDFGPFRLDVRERQLLHDGSSVPLRAKAFDTLLVLIQRSGHLVEKQELMNLVWGDSFVEEGNLTVVIHSLRKLLRDDGENDRKYIQTVAKRGYRFVADVHEIQEDFPSETEGDSPRDATKELEESKPWRWVSPEVSVRFMGSLVAVVVVVSIIILFAKQSATSNDTGIHSIAVLPFRPLHFGTEQQYIGIGIVDEVITQLGSTGKIAVRPTSSILKYAQSTLDPTVIGKEQKVDAVIEGNAELLSGQVRISVQLVRVRDGFVLWADSFKESSGQLSALEQEVTGGIERSLAVKSSAQGSVRPYRADPEAYQLYLHGLYYWDKRTQADVRESIDYFQKAINIDPHYALGYASLANAYVVLGSYGEAPWQVYPTAKAMALKAVDLDDSLAAAHASLAMVATHYEWNWSDAGKEFQRSIALNPNDSEVRVWYATQLAATGQYDDALAQARRAAELDPLSPVVNTTVSRILYWHRQYDLSISGYNRIIEQYPTFAAARIRCGVALLAKHQALGAARQFEAARQISGGNVYLDALIAYAQALSGDTNSARRELHLLQDRARNQYVPAFSIALVYIGLGERESALEWLERAYLDHSSYMVYAKTDALLDTVRSEPRFIALLNRMGLPTNQ